MDMQISREIAFTPLRWRASYASDAQSGVISSKHRTTAVLKGPTISSLTVRADSCDKLLTIGWCSPKCNILFWNKHTMLRLSVSLVRESVVGLYGCPGRCKGSSRLAGYEPRAERPASPRSRSCISSQYSLCSPDQPRGSLNKEHLVSSGPAIFASRICLVCMSATLSGADLTKSCSGTYILRAGWRTMRHLTMTWFRFDSAPATVKPQLSSSFVTLGGPAT